MTIIKIQYNFLSISISLSGRFARTVTYFHIDKPIIPSSNTAPKMIPGMNAACISVRQIYKIRKENFIIFYDEICVVYKLIFNNI